MSIRETRVDWTIGLGICLDRIVPKRWFVKSGVSCGEGYFEQGDKI